MRYLIYARYDPDRLLLLPEPSVDSPMTQSLYHYARGEAYAVLHDSNGVMREAALINGDKSILAVARNVLAGRLAMSQGRFADAAKAFEDAAHQQDTLLISTMDPPVWWYPIRRSVAAAMLADGKFEQAAQEARTSLTVWPNDPIALLALSRAEEALGQAANARHDAAAALGDWEGDIAKVDINTF
jgi:tetratricopeptide (TPR) repeat protein